MAHKPLRCLLRCTAELYYRNYCVLDHLKTVQNLEATQYGNIAETIERNLIEIAKPPLETLSETEMTDTDVAESLRPELIAFADRFKQFHEMLVYMPVHNVFPETIDCLKIAFGDEYDNVKPSIILGTFFSAYEFDFLEQVERLVPQPSAIWRNNEKVVALQLPVCDRHSPTTWAVLAHEMGHAIDMNNNISKSVSDLLRQTMLPAIVKWVEELCADLIAAEFFGPAAILPIISIQHCLFPLHAIHAYSPTHPAALARLQVVSDFLKDKYGFDYLSKERVVYRDLWEDSVMQFETSENQQALRQKNTEYENIILRIATALREKIDEQLQSSHMINDKCIARCMKRLRKSVPIGAQGDRRMILRNALKKYENTNFTSIDDQIQSFELLKERFLESPVDIPSLLLSCARRREKLMSAFVTSWPFGDPKDRIDQLCQDLERLDKLGVQSLQASATQRELDKSLPKAVLEPS